MKALILTMIIIAGNAFSNESPRYLTDCDLNKRIAILTAMTPVNCAGNTAFSGLSTLIEAVPILSMLAAAATESVTKDYIYSDRSHSDYIEFENKAAQKGGIIGGSVIGACYDILVGDIDFTALDYATRRSRHLLGNCRDIVLDLKSHLDEYKIRKQ